MHQILTAYASNLETSLFVAYVISVLVDTAVFLIAQIKHKLLQMKALL